MLHRPKSHFLWLFISVAVLASCGFHRRGDLDFPPQWMRIYVVGADRELVVQLSIALRYSGVQVVDSSTSAARIASAARIDLTDSQFERTVLTTDSSGRATAYQLHYLLTATLISRDGKALPPAQSISLRRAYQYSPSQQLSAEAEYNFLKTALRGEAVSQILRRLASLKR